MSDISADIIKKAASGDVGAFEQIYRETSGFVYNVALRIANNKEDAAEITQDVFMKIYHNIKNFKGDSSFKTWAYRIAANTAINFLRARPRDVSGKIDIDEAQDIAYSGNAPRDNIDISASEKRVEFLLSQLKPEGRACIVLREMEGLDYKEMASALNTNINTVRTRLKRARAKLAGLVKKEGGQNEL